MQNLQGLGRMKHRAPGSKIWGVGQKVHSGFSIRCFELCSNILHPILAFQDGSCRALSGLSVWGSVCGRKPSPDAGDCPQRSPGRPSRGQAVP